MRSKEEIRNSIREERAKLTKGWVKDNSWRAQQLLVGLPEFKKAKRVCCYLAAPDEVETDMIIEMCWTDGKKVCVPTFRKEMNQYGLSDLCKDTNLVKGKFGIMEPAEPEWLGLDNVDFIIVPGLAFDAFGGRLGHGGGYYDRILKGIDREVFKAGLAFDYQIYERVPMSANDVGMDIVVTEKWVFKSAGSAV